jgi:uncharacterized protein YegL
MTTNNILTSYIQLHSDNYKDIHDLNIAGLSNNETQKFGIATIKVDKIPITKRKQKIIFSIDSSGSMGDTTCNTVKSAIEHLYNMFENFLRHIITLDVEINIHINSFTSSTRTVITDTLVTKNNIEELITAIYGLKPDGGTDIGRALDSANNIIKQSMQEYAVNDITHIFLTDGFATQGIFNDTTLKELVNYDVNNIFVGLGKYHNAALLSCLCDNIRGEYRFIDNEENIDIVYGDIAFTILYKAVTNVRLVAENGMMYDTDKNKWTDILELPYLLGEAEKNIHVKTDVDNHLLFNIELSAETSSELEVDVKEYNDSLNVLPDLIDCTTGEPDKINLMVFAFRQKVMELMYKSMHITNIDLYKRDSLYILQKDFKYLFRCIKKYMKAHDLLKDIALLTLCNDIKISYKDLSTSMMTGSVHNMMYTMARHTSHSRQQSYNVSSQADDSNDNNCYFDSREVPPPPKLVRSYAITNDNNNCYFDSQEVPPPSPKLVRSYASNYEENAVDLSTQMDYESDEDLEKFVTINVDSQYTCETAIEMIRGVSGRN